MTMPRRGASGSTCWVGSPGLAVARQPRIDAGIGGAHLDIADIVIAGDVEKRVDLMGDIGRAGMPMTSCCAAPADMRGRKRESDSWQQPKSAISRGASPVAKGAATRKCRGRFRH